MTILVVGDANADLSAALSRFPGEGDDAPMSALSWSSGGSAANVAVALALLGERPRLLARVGRDPAAEVALHTARAAGADLGAIQIDNALATGLCFAAVSPSGERTFFSYRGANTALAAPEPDPLAGARWLHVAGHALLEGRQRATSLALIDAAAARAIPISLDVCLPTLRAWPTETLDLLPRLSVLFANELELEQLTVKDAKNAQVATISDDLGDLGALAFGEPLDHAPAIVAIKLGPRGCLIAAGRRTWRAPAFAVDAVDTNGCGDAFVAGFLYAHLRAQPLDRCATLGNALGGLAATRYGAAAALPDRAAVRAFLSEHDQHDLAGLLAGD